MRDDKYAMRQFIDIISEASAPSISDLPPTLQNLAQEVASKSWETAKRIIVSKTGSVQPRERFDDDLADAIFERIQRTSQVGQYDSVEVIDRLGRNARRLDGSKKVKVYRAAPRGAGIRPGDFCTSSREEAGFYKHGRHVVQSATFPAHDLIAVDGNMGGGQELIYLPIDYVRDEPVEFFGSFREFYDAANKA